MDPLEPFDGLIVSPKKENSEEASERLQQFLKQCGLDVRRFHEDEFNFGDNKYNVLEQYLCIVSVVFFVIGPDYEDDMDFKLCLQLWLPRTLSQNPTVRIVPVLLVADREDLPKNDLYVSILSNCTAIFLNDYTNEKKLLRRLNSLFNSKAVKEFKEKNWEFVREKKEKAAQLKQRKSKIKECILFLKLDRRLPDDKLKKAFRDYNFGDLHKGDEVKKSFDTLADELGLSAKGLQEEFALVYREDGHVTPQIVISIKNGYIPKAMKKCKKPSQLSFKHFERFLQPDYPPNRDRKQERNQATGLNGNSNTFEVDGAPNIERTDVSQTIPYSVQESCRDSQSVEKPIIGTPEETREDVGHIVEQQDDKDVTAMPEFDVETDEGHESSSQLLNTAVPQQAGQPAVATINQLANGLNQPPFVPRGPPPLEPDIPQEGQPEPTTALASMRINNMLPSGSGDWHQLESSGTVHAIEHKSEGNSTSDIATNGGAPIPVIVGDFSDETSANNFARSRNLHGSIEQQAEGLNEAVTREGDPNTNLSRQRGQDMNEGVVVHSPDMSADGLTRNSQEPVSNDIQTQGAVGGSSQAAVVSRLQNGHTEGLSQDGLPSSFEKSFEEQSSSGLPQPSSVRHWDQSSEFGSILGGGSQELVPDFSSEQIRDIDTSSELYLSEGTAV